MAVIRALAMRGCPELTDQFPQFRVRARQVFLDQAHFPRRTAVPARERFLESADAETEAGKGLRERVVQFVRQVCPLLHDGQTLCLFVETGFLDGHAQVAPDAGQQVVHVLVQVLRPVIEKQAVDTQRAPLVLQRHRKHRRFLVALFVTDPPALMYIGLPEHFAAPHYRAAYTASNRQQVAAVAVIGVKAQIRHQTHLSVRSEQPGGSGACPERAFQAEKEACQQVVEIPRHVDAGRHVVQHFQGMGLLLQALGLYADLFTHFAGQALQLLGERVDVLHQLAEFPCPRHGNAGREVATLDALCPVAQMEQRGDQVVVDHHRDGQRGEKGHPEHEGMHHQIRDRVPGGEDDPCIHAECSQEHGADHRQRKEHVVLHHAPCLVVPAFCRTDQPVGHARRA
jgi:hypothetical protein